MVKVTPVTVSIVVIFLASFIAAMVFIALDGGGYRAWISMGISVWFLGIMAILSYVPNRYTLKDK